MFVCQQYSRDAHSNRRTSPLPNKDNAALLHPSYSSIVKDWDLCYVFLRVESERHPFSLEYKLFSNKNPRFLFIFLCDQRVVLWLHL